MSDERDQKALQLTKRNQQFKNRIATLEKRQEQLDTEHKKLGQRLNKMPQAEIDKDHNRFDQLKQRYDRVGKLAEKNRATLNRTREEHKDFRQKHQFGKDATHDSPSHSLGYKKNEQGNYRARGLATEGQKKRMGAIQRQRQVPGQNTQTVQTNTQQQTQTSSQQRQQPDLSKVKKLETHGQQRKNTLAKYQSGKSSTHQPGKKQAISGEKQTSLGAYAKETPKTQQPQTDVSKISSSQKPKDNQQTQSQNNSAMAKKDSLATYKADQKIPNSKGNDRMPGGMNQGSMSNKYPANKGVSKSSSTPPPSKGPDKGQGR